MHTTAAIVTALLAWSASAAPGSAGLSWRIEYDEAGRVARSYDPAGRPTQYAYTSRTTGLPQSVTQTPPEGAPVTWRFDAGGRMASMSDGEGEVTYRYDNHGLLEAIARKGAPEVRYTYDIAGRLAELRVGDFYHVAWTYDFLGRIAKVDTPAGAITYAYLTGQNTVVRSLPNGIKTFWKRQANGQLEQITHGFFKKPDDTRYSVLAEYTYEHGPDGRIAAIRERSGQGVFTRQYTYDTMGRLTHATGPDSRAYRYAYDLVGNRVKATATGRPEQVCTYDWIGRLTSVDGTLCSYDACGNLTEVTLDGVARQYRYQSDGRLTEARVGGETVQYRYDGFGHLIARKTAEGKTRFIPEPLSPFWQPLVMEEPDGKRTLVIWDRDTPLALVGDGQVEWLLHDHLGSVRAVADGKGNVKRQRQYDPFGVLGRTERPGTLAPGFAGLFWDGTGNRYLTLARDLVPELGVFRQPDPQKPVPHGSQLELGMWTYCGGDPVNLVDVDGAESREPVSFNSHDRWWDAFGRTFRYHTIGAPARWLYTLGGGKPAGLALNTDPDERDYMISDVIKEAQKRVGEDPSALHTLLKNWREDFSQRPDQFRHAVTSHEWKVIENAAYSDVLRSRTTHDVLVYDGHIPKPIVGLIPDRDARVPSWLIKAGTLKWDISHGIGELTGLPPSFFDKRTGEQWLTNTPATRKAYDFGLSHWVQKSTDVPNEPRQSPFNTKVKRPSADYPISFSPPSGPGGGGWGGWPPPPPPPPPLPGGSATLTPSHVGGVYLGGAGGAVEGLGALKGVQLDANGNLILVGEEARDVKMPPLRLDDVVTVFRSVYIHGEGPTVTIDPNPEDPEGSAMIIRHGKATEDTYVGWVLYEADRLMKGYTIGVDNLTEKDVVSQVPGYADVQNAIYFGSADPRKSQKEGIWERFWIVPAEARRFEGSRRAMTLFDVPLKVKTQKMKWQKGELVDDLTGESSPGAVAFTGWFTASYDAIAAEQYLVPPAEAGITNPVPVFTELRRVALMTAIAEKLRDQGVPMPFWMRDYEVRKVPFERFTPGMEVTRRRSDGNVIRTSRIFGGVELSPESKAVKTYTTAADVAMAPAEVRAELNRTVELADRLEGAVADAMPSVASAPLAIHRVAVDNRTYQTVSVPGTKTLALGPSRMDEIDLAVPVVGGRDIRLVRSFNSFFNPKGPWGEGWALDLPRLQEIRVPVTREGNESTYAICYELITPLNSLYARFRDVRPVPDLQNARLQVPDKDGPFYGLANDHPAFLVNTDTLLLLLKNGSRWHFTPRGDLVAIEDGPQVTVYERGNKGQVTRIVALVGDAPVARIDLEYTSKGTLSKAVGGEIGNPKSKPVEVTYTYAPSGRLAGVGLAEGMVGYGYQGPWVASVTWTEKTSGAKPEMLRTFEYNAQGQVTTEKQGESTLSHAIVASSDGGVEASVTATADGGSKNTTRYDRQMRPVEALEADGTHTVWTYKSDGGTDTTITTPDKRQVTLAETAGGRQRTVRMDGEPEITGQFDAAGRLTAMSEGGQTILEQEWQPDGQISEVVTGPHTASFQYSERGLLSSVIEHPSAEKDRFQRWQETTFDRRGLPTRLTDFSGVDVSLAYDDSGALASAVQKTPEGNLGYSIQRDGTGRILAMKSSWGDTSYGYTEAGDLQRIETKHGTKSASVDLSGGLVRQVTGFDKGVTTFAYHDKDDMAGEISDVVCANGLKLAHEYDGGGRLASVVVGTDRRVRLDYDADGRVVEYALEPLTPFKWFQSLDEPIFKR